MVFLKFTICTIIVNHLWKTHEAMKVHHIFIAYKEMHDLLLVSMEKTSIFD